MKQDAQNDPIPAAAREVVALFDGPLEGVRFPDIDRDVLGELSAAVHQRASEVESLRTQLAEARLALEESQRQLVGTAEKAVAYARVFACDDPELTATLDGLEVARRPEALMGGLKRKRAPRTNGHRLPEAREEEGQHRIRLTELPLAG